MVESENFRAYVYAKDGKKKMVNSWNEFRAHVETGHFFATKEAAENVSRETSVIAEEFIPKPRPRKKVVKDANGS